jgi:hypothetical protein
MFNRFLDETEKFFSPLNPAHILTMFKDPAPRPSLAAEQQPLVNKPPPIPPRPSKAAIKVVIPEKKPDKKTKPSTKV